MKKTLFLGTILGAALCSSTFAETTTVTVNGVDYANTNVITATPAAGATFEGDYVLIGGTNQTIKGQNTKAGEVTTPAWITGLTASQTIISAPATAGETSHSGNVLFLDTGGNGNVIVNANILAGGGAGNALRFWGGSSVKLNGDLTVVGDTLNIWSEAGTHEFNGALHGTADQTLHIVKNSTGTSNGTTMVKGALADFAGTIQVSSGTLNVTDANMANFNGTIAVDNNGSALVENSLIGVGYKAGSVLSYKDGVLDEASSTLVAGTSWASSLTKGEDGRYAAVKNGNQVTLVAGSENELASVSTTGTNGGWLVVEGVGDTANNVYTDVTLNSTGASTNGLIIGASGSTAHIGALAGAASQAEVRGDWNGSGKDRVLAVHQDTDTTFAGKFIEKNVTDGRDVALTKYGTGTLTLTGDNQTHKTLTVEEGGVTISGTGTWKGSVDVNGGQLTLAGSPSAANPIGAVTIADGASMVVTDTAVVTITSLDSTNGSVTVNGSLLVNSGDAIIKALTLSDGSTITLGDHTPDLIVSNATIAGNTTIEADVVLANGGTMTFESGVVTLGCTVEFGEGTTIALGTAYYDELAANGKVLLFTGVDAVNGLINGLENVVVTGDFVPGKLIAEQQTDGSFNIYATPEPATATLSLLALAGLMARRRRH